MPASNICAGCSSEVVMIPETADDVEAVGLWYITVRRPAGDTVQSGPFCVGCMGELSSHGVRLHESQG